MEVSEPTISLFFGYLDGMISVAYSKAYIKNRFLDPPRPFSQEGRVQNAIENLFRIMQKPFDVSRKR